MQFIMDAKSRFPAQDVDALGKEFDECYGLMGRQFMNAGREAAGFPVADPLTSVELSRLLDLSDKFFPLSTGPRVRPPAAPDAASAPKE